MDSLVILTAGLEPMWCKLSHNIPPQILSKRKKKRVHNEFYTTQAIWLDPWSHLWFFSLKKWIKEKTRKCKSEPKLYNQLEKAKLMWSVLWYKYALYLKEGNKYLNETCIWLMLSVWSFAISNDIRTSKVFYNFSIGGNSSFQRIIYDIYHSTYKHGVLIIVDERFHILFIRVLFISGTFDVVDHFS